MAKNTLIGGLKISLLAVTKGYTKGMGRASKATKRFTRLLRTNVSTALGLALGKLTAFGARGLGSIPRLVAGAVRSLARLVKMLAITLVAAAGAAGVALALLAKNSLKDLDRLAKSSRIIGLTVNELKALELAASEAGVETKVLEKSLRNMTRQVNDAAKGTGEAVDALEDLGLNAKKLAAQSIPEQFMAIADALEQVKDRGERIQLAFDLFGGRGLSLLNLTSGAIRGANDELARMGLLISDIDSKKIEKFNDAVGDLKRAFKGVGDQIAIGLAPVLGGVVAKMIALIEGLGGIDTIVGEAIAAAKPKILAFADSFAKVGIFIATRLSAGLTVAAEAMTGLGDKSLLVKNIIQTGFGTAADVIKLAFLSVKFTVLGILAFITKGVDKMIDGVVASINVLARDIEKVGEFFSLDLDLEIKRNKDNSLTAVADSFVADANKASADIEKVWNSLLKRALKVPREAQTGLDDFIKSMGDKIAALTNAGAEDFANLTEAINEALIDTPAGERITILLEKMRSNFDALGGAIRQAGEDFEDMGQEGEDALEPIVTISAQAVIGINALHSGIDGMARALARSITRAENLFEAFRKIAINVIEDIIAAFIRMAAFKFLISLFPGSSIVAAVTGIAVKSAGGGGKGGGGGGGKSSAAKANAAFSAPALAAPSGGGVTIIFNGPTSGDDAILKQVVKGIREAQPDLTNIAVAEVQRRVGRDPLFLDRGI